MNNPILSILIPTVTGRELQASDLFLKILSQFKGTDNIVGWSNPADDRWYGYDFPKVEIIFCKDDKRMTIGEKRELLYKAANGVYALQVDDDDSLSDDAIEKILAATEEGKDCITYEEHIDMDGKILKSNHSIYYQNWEGDGHTELEDGFHFWRTPFMKSVIRTEIAQKVPVPRVRFAEDFLWSKLLKEHLHSETHIPEQIYKYIYRATPSIERYGLDKD